MNLFRVAVFSLAVYIPWVSLFAVGTYLMYGFAGVPVIAFSVPSVIIGVITEGILGGVTTCSTRN